MSGSPTAAVRVCTQSSAEKMPLISVRGANSRPGHVMIAGTR